MVVFGGMGSIRGAFVGALIVGLIDTLGRAYLRWATGFVLPPVAANTVAPALSSMMIYIAMALMLVLRPEGLIPAPGTKAGSSAGATVVVHPPTHLRGLLAPWRIAALALAGLVLFILPMLAFALDRPFWPVLVARMMIYAIAALSLDLLLGRTGLVSFGHALYLGIGAYVVGILSLAGVDNGFIQWTAAMIVAALISVPLAIVSLRTSGTFFIMITLAFAQMTFYAASSLYDLGGDDGMALTTRSSFGRLDLSDPTIFYYVVLALLVAIILGNVRLVRSRFGEVLRGIRINETRMRALGCPTLAYKTMACAIAAAVCGLAGALLANVTEFVGPQYMEWSRSGELIVMVIMGGAGTVLGPIVGAFAYLGLEKLLSDWIVHWRLLLGAVLVAIAFFERGGLLVLFKQTQDARAPGRLRWMPHWKLRASRNASAD